MKQKNMRNAYTQELVGELLSVPLAVRPEAFGISETQRLTGSDFQAEGQFPASSVAGGPFSFPLGLAKRASTQRKTGEALPLGRKTRPTPKFRWRIRSVLA
jgi:hypothetical protein